MRFQDVKRGHHIMKKNNPIYEYLGFHLLSAQIRRERSFVPKEIDILIDKIKHDADDFSFNTTIKASEDENASFSFVFSARFKLLDEEWNKTIGDDETLAGILFPVAFPYFRQSIFAATNDSLGAIALPIIDLRGIKIGGGLKLIRKTNSKVK